MLPRGVDGILVVGLGISAERDAVPLIRMQPDVQNGGYAAGVAAAMAAKDGVSIRHVDIDRLQKHLVNVGNRLKEVDGELVFSQPSQFFADTFRTLELHHLFELFPSDRDAATYFAGGAA